MQPEKRAVILSAVPVSAGMAAYLCPGDRIIACDAGYRNAAILGVTPHLIIGDFDSAPCPKAGGDTIVLPHVKDDTDTQYAARWLADHGFTHVTLLGALGGRRMEHTLANLSTGLYLAGRGVTALLADEQSEIRYLVPGKELCLERKDWAYLSVFPLDGALTGLDIEGVFYPLQNAVLRPDYPLGVSNEFTAPAARLRCIGGYGAVILTRADG